MSNINIMKYAFYCHATRHFEQQWYCLFFTVYLRIYYPLDKTAWNTTFAVVTVLNSKTTHHRGTENTEVFLFSCADGAENYLNFLLCAEWHLLKERMIILTVIPACLWQESIAFQAGFRLETYRNDENTMQFVLSKCHSTLCPLCPLCLCVSVSLCLCG